MTDLKRIAYRLEHAAGVYRDQDDEAAADQCMEYAAELLSAPDDNDLLSNPRAHDHGGHYLPPSDDDGKRVTHNDTTHPGYLVVVAPAVATLSFDMTTPDGRRMHRDALQGEACRLALWEMDQKLRALHKHGVENTAYEGRDPATVCRMLRDVLFQLCDDHGIRLDED